MIDKTADGRDCAHTADSSRLPLVHGTSNDKSTVFFLNISICCTTVSRTMDFNRAFYYTLLWHVVDSAEVRPFAMPYFCHTGNNNDT